MSEDTIHRDDGEGGGSDHGTTGRAINASGHAVARIGRVIARIGALLNPATMGSRIRRIRDGTLRSNMSWSRIRSLEPTAVASGLRLPTAVASGLRLPTAVASELRLPTAVASGLRLPTVTASGRRAWDRTPALLRGMLFGLLMIGVFAIAAVVVA